MSAFTMLTTAPRPEVMVSSDDCVPPARRWALAHRFWLPLDVLRESVTPLCALPRRLAAVSEVGTMAPGGLPNVAKLLMPWPAERLIFCCAVVSRLPFLVTGGTAARSPGAKTVPTLGDEYVTKKTESAWIAFAKLEAPACVRASKREGGAWAPADRRRGRRARGVAGRMVIWCETRVRQL